MANSQGDQIEMPVKSNFREGLSVSEYMISCYGSRKGLMDTALGTADAGYLTRRMVDVAHSTIIQNYDCLTKHGIIPKYLSKRIIGRILNSNVSSKTGLLISKKGILIGPQLLQTFLSLNLLKLQIRSPLTCENVNIPKICQLCYGALQTTLVDLFEVVGIIAAQSIGEPGTQLTLRTFHTGGVFSGNIAERFYSPIAGSIFYSDHYIRKLILPHNYGRYIYLTTQQTEIYLLETSSKDLNLSNCRKIKLILPKTTLIFIPTKSLIWKKQMLGQIIKFSKAQFKNRKHQKVANINLRQSAQFLFSNQFLDKELNKKIWLRYGHIILPKKLHVNWGFYKLADQCFFNYNSVQVQQSKSKSHSNFISNFSFTYYLTRLSTSFFWLHFTDQNSLLLLKNSLNWLNFNSKLKNQKRLSIFFLRSSLFSKRPKFKFKIEIFFWYYFLADTFLLQFYTTLISSNSLLTIDQIQFFVRINWGWFFLQTQKLSCLILFTKQYQYKLSSQVKKKIQSINILGSLESYPLSQYCPRALLSTTLCQIYVPYQLKFSVLHSLIYENLYFFIKGKQLVNINFPYTNEIKRITQLRVGLNLGQIYFFPFNLDKKLLIRLYEIFFIGKPFYRLSYNLSKTDDITQGLPKIEELLEVRQTKNYKTLIGNPSIQLEKKFKLYLEKFGFIKATKLSLLEIQNFMVDSVQEIYQAQGVNINDKHIEIIIKQMTSKAEIQVFPLKFWLDKMKKNKLIKLKTRTKHFWENSERYEIFHGYLRNEIIDLAELTLKNQQLALIQKPLIYYTPKIFGITKIGLNFVGILSAASFQQTITILTTATIEGHKDWLNGLKERIIIGKRVSFKILKFL